MYHGEKKVAKIIEELTMYFFTVGADKMTSGITVENQNVVIDFKSNYKPEYKDALDKLVKYLNEPKNEGIEDFYWELAGSGDPGESSQLLLLGMMIDRADIHISDAEVSLKLYKTMEEE